MVPDSRIAELASGWEEALRVATMLSLYDVGRAPADETDADLLARAHQALLDEEDPREFLTRLSAKAFPLAMAREPSPTLAPTKRRRVKIIGV